MMFINLVVQLVYGAMLLGVLALLLWFIILLLRQHRARLLGVLALILRFIIHLHLRRQCRR